MRLITYLSWGNILHQRAGIDAAKLPRSLPRFGLRGARQEKNEVKKKRQPVELPLKRVKQF